MAKLSIKPGSESVSLLVFIQDSASTTGGGKTGLAYNTASYTAYYVRPGAAASSISLVTQTVTGAWASGGFVEVDATNMPGVYRFDVPNAVLAAGVRSAVVMLKGASGMAPLVLEVDLGAQVDVALLSGDAGAADNAEAFFDGTGYAGTNNVIPTVTALTGHTAQTGDAYARIGSAGAGLTALGDTRLVNLDAAVSTRSTYAGGDTSGVTTLLARIVGTLATGTHNPQTGDAFARLGAPAGASVSADIANLPTNTALATALGTADDATLAAIAALNNLSSAQAQSAAAAALAAYDPPTNAEMEARTLPTANYFDPAADVVAHVTLVDTTTTNTDMVAAAPTAAANADAVWDELLAGHVGVGSAGAALTAASSGGDPSVLADAVWDEALAGHVIVGSAGAGLAAAGSAGDPWSTTLPGAYTGNQAGAILDAIRDVTSAIDTSAVTVTSTNNSGVLTFTQGVTFAATVSGLTISATWTKLYFTLKESDYDTDDMSLIQIVETNPGAGTDGLLYLNSAALVLPIVLADGTLTVSQAGGTVAIAITDNAMAQLSKASGLVWDIKTKDAAGATVQNATGTASVTRAVTQTI